MRISLILLLLILIPAVYADMNIDMSISKNDIIIENFEVAFFSEKKYDSFEFVSISEPLNIDFDGEYIVTNVEEGYIIQFFQEINEGGNIIDYTILYDNLIQKSGSGKVLRTSFYSVENDSINIDLKLPEGYYLSGDPSTSPQPEEITSDGQQINLNWLFEEKGSIVVFYETNKTSILPYVITLIIFIIILLIVFGFHKKKTSNKITEMLSVDEKKILEKIKEGVPKQKDIAKSLEFSKSKMSKVVRKLEEKNLIVREPHFKTNILKIKK